MNPGEIRFEKARRMPDEERGSVTSWIDLLKEGDPLAAQRLWERYFMQLVRLARSKLMASSKRDAGSDEEDAALSAFDSFCAGAARGRFPKLTDRNSLWRLLMVITERKVTDQFVRQRRKKRGSGRVLNESALLGGKNSSAGGLDVTIGRDPTPEFAAILAEEFQHLLDALGDDAMRKIAVWRLEGYTKDEIAQKLDCSPRTVAYKVEFIRKTWMSRGSA